jgi:hypothetical protein
MAFPLRRAWHWPERTLAPDNLSCPGRPACCVVMIARPGSTTSPPPENQQRPFMVPTGTRGLKGGPMRAWSRMSNIWEACQDTGNSLSQGHSTPPLLKSDRLRPIQPGKTPHSAPHDRAPQPVRHLPLPVPAQPLSIAVADRATARESVRTTVRFG